MATQHDNANFIRRFFRVATRIGRGRSTLTIRWQSRWRAFDAVGREDEFVRKLASETGEMNPQHPLHGKACRIIGWLAPPGKDFILSLVDESAYAYVHLTFSKETDPRWPRSKLFRNVDEVNRFLRDWGE
jgi:hypothetical protein